jgi:hypothetical protein
MYVLAHVNKDGVIDRPITWMDDKFAGNIKQLALDFHKMNGERYVVLYREGPARDFTGWTPEDTLRVAS